MSAADRLAIIEAELTALAGVPAVDRAGGDHLVWAHRMLAVRRRVEALTAGSLDAMACSAQWATAGGGRTAAAWLAGSTTEAPQVVKTLLANGAFARRHALLDEAAAAGEVSQTHVSRSGGGCGGSMTASGCCSMLLSPTSWTGRENSPRRVSRRP